MTKKMTSADYFYIWTLLRNIAHMTGRIRDRELSRYGVTLMQSSVLYMIKALGDDATPSNISRWVFREPPTVSDILTRMEKQGLVKRLKTKRKGLVLIKLTAAGERAYEKSTLRESISRIMSQIPDENLEQLRPLLEEIRILVMQDMGLSAKEMHLPNSDL
jgi:DNA-binding MarR family transcriptional regulator